jgi:hypothetical protein
MKKRFHVTFFLANRMVAKGANYYCENEVEAITLWKAEYGNSTFLYMSSDEVLNYKHF